MKNKIHIKYHKFIITYFMSFLIIFFFSFVSYAQTQESGEPAEVSNFDEFVSAVNQMQSTGGTIVLKDDIKLPAEETFIYNNGRYRKEVIIETNGHTIQVEGYLSLWPYLTIKGDGSNNELFHIYPGGDMRVVSICIDAGEDGVAIIQEEGSFLTFGSETDLGLPEFSCTGQVISPQTITAAAYWKYDCEKLPIVIIPEDTDFSPDMLPDKVLSAVNRDYNEYEEDIPVVWDKDTFPTEHKRTVVKGNFTDEYSPFGNHNPACLVIWESNTNPYFMNVYLESMSEFYDMIFMYGKSPQPGTIYIQSSDDGDKWTDIAGTEGYNSLETGENEDFSWILSYDKTQSANQVPKYYRMMQILEDGTKLYSDALELSDELIFTTADIEGGRGGETSPNEGENQLPNNISGTENTNETSRPNTPDSSYHPESVLGSDYYEQPKNETDKPEESVNSEHTEESSYDNLSEPENTSPVNNITDDEKSENNESSGVEITIGILIFICILLASVALSVLKKKNK